MKRDQIKPQRGDVVTDRERPGEPVPEDQVRRRSQDVKAPPDKHHTVAQVEKAPQGRPE